MPFRRLYTKRAKKSMPRRVVRRRRARLSRYPRNRSGFIKVIRKVGDCFIQNAAIAGTIQVNDTTGTMLNVLASSPVSTGFANTYDIPFAMKFCLSQILNSSDITNICDRYKIKKTVIRIYFNSNGNSVQSSYSLPQITYVPDYDDASIPTPAAVREKMGAKIKYFNDKNFVTIVLYPRPVSEIYNNGVTTAYAPKNQQWIDCAYPSVEHYGLKGVLQNVNLTSSPFQVGFKWDVEHTIYGKDIQ